jgi:hypothetical protein
MVKRKYNNITKKSRFGFDPDHIDDNQNKNVNSDLNLFYTKRSLEYQLHYSKLDSHTKSSEIEISKDHYNNTIYDNQIQQILDYRQNWKRVDNPFDYSHINFAFVGSDVSIVPSIGVFQLDEVDESGDITSYEVIMRDMYAKNKTKFIEMYEKKMYALENIKSGSEFLKKFKGTAVLNRYILDRSQFANRIAQITSIVGDKTKLYNLIRSYGKLNNVKLSDKLIPKTIEINVTNLINDLKEVYSKNWEGYIIPKLKELLSSGNDSKGDINNYEDNSMWVVKPTGGSRGRGMRFATLATIKNELWGWMQEPFSQNGNKPYNEWMISRFIMSFLWKLNNSKPDSLKLCEYPKNQSPFGNETKTGLWDNSPVLELVSNKPGKINTQMTKYSNGIYNNVPYYKQYNPSLRIGKAGNETNDSKKFSDFRNHSFNDVTGRINKARLWFVMELANGKYKIHVYNKVSFEVCAVEFDPDNIEHYTDKQRLWTDSNSFYYGTKENIPDWAYCKYNLDNVNAKRASELDCNYVVNWTDGKYNKGDEMVSFPINWKDIKKNIINLLTLFSEATKDGIHAISEARELANKQFESKGAFQYFGLDFIVDPSANVWLLEINTRPWSGHGNWWFKNFDTTYSHIIPKWLFLEGMVRKFVDPHFNEPKRLPYNDINLSSDFENITDHNYIKLENPVVGMKQVISKKDDSNWIVNRQLHKIFKARGWGTFPFAELLRNPKLIYQGMTSYIRYLSEQNITKEEFDNKVLKMYPYLKKASIVNKIFSIVGTLGDKAKLTQILKETYPIQRTSECPSATCLSWDQLIPYTVTFSTDDPNWKSLIPNNNYQMIAKPALGKQGTGIIISDSHTEIINHISSRTVDKSWVVSKYISDPLILKDRKSHIRTFFLIFNDNNTLKVFSMNVDLIFFAALPYYKDDTDKFLNTFAVSGAKLKPAIISKYKDITNLSKGNEFFRDFVKPAKKITDADLVGYVKNSIETKLQSDTQRNKKDFGYKVLSANAQKVFEEHNISFEPIQMQINNITKQTIYAIRDELRCTNPGNCYQYIALDFMVDSTSKVWLLEVNSNPGLKSPTAQIKPGGLTRFMNGIMNITLDDNAMIREVNNKEYYIPKVMRSKSETELSENTRKLTLSYPTVFNELMTIPNIPNIPNIPTIKSNIVISTNKKSDIQVRTTNKKMQEMMMMNALSGNKGNKGMQEMMMMNTLGGGKMDMSKMTEMLLMNQFFSGKNGKNMTKMFGNSGKFLKDLYMWQIMTGKDANSLMELQMKMKTQMDHPYLFMFGNPKETVNCNEVGGVRCVEVSPGVLVPQSHLVLGLAGVKGFNNAGFFNLPRISAKTITMVKNMQKFNPLLSMFCKLYNDKEMLKTIAVRFGIPHVKKMKVKALCDYVLASLIIYKSLGLIEIELPFANEIFAGTMDLNMDNNPVAMQLMSSLFNNDEWIPWMVMMNKQSGKEEVVPVDAAATAAFGKKRRN